MGNLCTCDHPDSDKPIINIEQSIDFNVKNEIYEQSSCTEMRNKTFEEKHINEQSIIQEAINDNLLFEDNYEFDSELFYCWVTGDIEDETSLKFKFNLHIIDKQGKKGYYTFSSNYTKIQQIYSSAYRCRKKYFPQSKFSDQFTQDHKNDEQLTLMQRYMVLYEILWADHTQHAATILDLHTCCDALIKLLNAPLFVQQKSNVLLSLGMQLKMKDLLQNVAKQWIVSLTERAKADGYCGNDSDSPIYQLMHWSHLTFHTLSLVERPNNRTSTHWGLKFEGDNYLFSVDWFNKDVVYYQLLSNDALGQRIAWYSWINQTQFVQHWSERARIPFLKPVTFHVIGRLVAKWKVIYNKFHVFDNNCQHFARDLLSVFALNAAKKLTDETQNVFITANMTLTKEFERIDLISNKLKKQLNQDYDKIKNDEMYKWLKQIGLPQYYHIFKQKAITLNILHNNLNAMDILQDIIIDDGHISILKQNIHVKYEDNWEGVQSFLDDLNLKDSQSVVDKFEEQGINDMATLCEINDKILKTEIGIQAWANRNKIVRAMKHLCRDKI